MRSTQKGFLAAIAALSLLAGVIATPSYAAQPPRNKTYFTIYVGLEAPYSWDAGCLSFTANAMCATEDLCGTWAYDGAPGREAGIEFEITDGEVRIEGKGRIDDRGKGDSLGGVAQARVGGQRFNFSFTGRSTKRNKCARLLREWEGEGVAVR